MVRLLKTLAVFAAAIGVLVFAWTRLPIETWYRDGRPTRFGKVTNRTMGRFAALGVPAFGMVTLEVPGRRTGRPTSTVLVLAKQDGREYLVSMLGPKVDWVRNAEAAGYDVVLKHGSRRLVHLTEVPANERAPLLKRYLDLAPGGRPHIPVPVTAPVEEFEAVAADYPVFWVEPRA